MPPYVVLWPLLPTLSMTGSAAAVARVTLPAYRQTAQVGAGVPRGETQSAAVRHVDGAVLHHQGMHRVTVPPLIVVLPL